MKRSLYYFLAFTKKGYLVSSWHVLRTDGRTVCGRDLPVSGTFGGRVSLETIRKLAGLAPYSPWSPNMCSSCLRMMDAETMRLA